MKRKRIMALLMTTMLFVGCLAGCGDKSSNADTNDNNGDTAQTDNNGDTTDNESTSSGDNTITISVQTGEGIEAGWKAVAEAYNEIHPEVNIVIDLKSTEGYDQWLNNVFANYETTSVDIVNINLAAEAATGKSINYADYIDNDSPYSDGTWKEQFEYDMQTLAAGTGDFNALSLESVQVMWLYNQDIFNEVGVEPPTTWAELIDVCEKIEAAGYQAIAMPGDYDSFYSGTMGWLAQVYADQTTRSTVELWRSQEGDYTYDPDIDAYFEYDPTDPYNDDTTYVTRNPVRFYKAVNDGTYSAVTDGMKTVWSSFADVFPQYAGDDVMFGTDADGAKALFYQGKAAMMVEGGWAIIQFANDMEALASGEEITNSAGETIEGAKSFTLGTFNMPSMEGAGIEAPARTIEVANGFLGCVSKTQEHNDLVVDFLMFYSSPEGMSAYIDAGLEAGLVPNGPSLVYGVTYPDDVQNAFENLTMIGNCQKSYGNSLARGFGEIAESYRSFYNYSYDYLTGAIDVDNFLQQHQQNIMDNLEQAMSNEHISFNDLENPASEPTGE